MLLKKKKMYIYIILIIIKGTNNSYKVLLINNLPLIKLPLQKKTFQTH